ncbi:MAG: Ger(x)C family spore germination protein [Syntrophomonas sp.]
MVKKVVMIVCILSLFTVSGCWDLREVNANSISTGVGVESQGDDKITFSAQLVRPLPPGETSSGQMESVVATTNDYGVALAARRLSLSLAQVPEWSHVRTLILGEKLVDRDVTLVVDFMTRNRHLRPDTNLMIASQVSPEELLSSKLPNVTDLGSGLQDLLRLNEKELGIYVPTTMGEFTYKLMTPGIEPVVPQITLEKAKGNETPEKAGDKNSGNTNNKKSRIILNGTAVFKGKKMVGTLNENESRGYRWLNATSKAGGLFNTASPLNPNNYITLEIIQFSSKTRADFSQNRLKMIVEINADLGFYQQDSDNALLTLERKSQLQEAANLEIKRQIAACIKKSQELNSDVLGWGRIIQEYEPDQWKELAAVWPEQFPLIESEIKVESNIKRSMLANESFRFQ